MLHQFGSSFSVFAGAVSTFVANKHHKARESILGRQFRSNIPLLFGNWWQSQVWLKAIRLFRHVALFLVPNFSRSSCIEKQVRGKTREISPVPRTSSFLLDKGDIQVYPSYQRAEFLKRQAIVAALSSAECFTITG